MKLHCHLRTLRGTRSVRSVAAEAGVSAGVLSQIEQGRALPRDDQVTRLEAAYGHPIEQWYPRLTLLAISEET